MKSTFTLNPFIQRMIIAANYDEPKLINACQASLNSATLTAEEAKRGNVKLVSKEAEFRFSESNRLDYLGKTDAPAKFIRWHDQEAAVFKRCGEPSEELTIAILPASDKAWLDRRFSLEAAKGRGNGDVKSIKTPAVPA